MVNVISAQTLDDALSALRRAVKKGEERGEKNLIFCEDRLTLLAERAILSELGGTFDTEVSTFARFLSGSGKTLSKYGSVIEMSSLIAENRESLHCFGTGSAQSVYETIAQLSASRVRADELREGAESVEGTLKNKLLDLAFLQEKYEAFLLERNLLDENAYLGLLPDQLSKANLGGTNVIFFAFPSFTRQAQEGIRAAIENALSVTGIFLGGEADFYTGESLCVFRRVAKEYGEIKNYAMPCSLCGDALTLQQSLFSPERYGGQKIPSESITVSVCEDEEEELGQVAALIGRYVHQGVRYRDMALLVPDQESYAAVEKVFSAYRVPFFADKKRAFSTHPFCRFLLDVLSGAATGGLPSDADAIASSRYFGEGDSYRNYLARHGAYRGAYRKEIGESAAEKYDLTYLCACREKMISLLSLFPKKATGEEYVAAVRALWDMVGGEGITSSLSEQFDGEEKNFLDVSPLENILSDVEGVAGRQLLTVREFSDLLKSGMDALEVSMIPAYNDAVFVGDATESKFSAVKILFVIGLTDALPRASADTAIISDGEIARLSKLEVQIEPAIAQVNARAREALALNLCSFTKKLFLFYPTRIGLEEGRASEAIQYVKNAFSTLPMPKLFPYDCRSRQAALLRLTEEKHREAEGRFAEEYSSLVPALTQCGEGEIVKKLLADEKEYVISCGEQLYFGGGSVSPTLLEKYFDCPYAGFAERGLYLQRREEGGMQKTDSGNFIHALLEQVAEKFASFRSEEEVIAFAREKAAELLRLPAYLSAEDTPSGKYASSRLVEEGVKVSLELYRQLVGSGFTVQTLEGKIYLPEVSVGGKADRVDEGEGYVRVIDYKTGTIEEDAKYYYVGKKLQLQLYLKGACKGKKPAGAFYFPAQDKFVAEDEHPFRMRGFYNEEETCLRLLDKDYQPGRESPFFETDKPNARTKKGMSEEDFRDFLDYSLLIAAKAEREMKEGNVAPSPYQGACEYCRLKGMCGFDGEARKISSVSSDDIVSVVRRETGKTGKEE